MSSVESCMDHTALMCFRIDSNGNSTLPRTSYEPNLTLLTWFPRDLVYLSMLFILEVLCTEGSAEHLKNK